MRKTTLKNIASPKKKRISTNDLSEVSFFKLQDDVIALRPFGRKELLSDDYLKWMNDPSVTQTIGRYDYLMPVSRKKLIDYFNGLDSASTIFLAIYRMNTTSRFKPEKCTFIGTLKIYDIDALSRRASIGILIGEKQEWGKGHAQRAIRLASQYIFDVLGLRKIFAGYLSTNIGMERAFLKNGFKKEAVFKKHLYFAGHLVDHVFVSKFRSQI